MNVEKSVEYIKDLVDELVGNTDMTFYSGSSMLQKEIFKRLDAIETGYKRINRRPRK